MRGWEATAVLLSGAMLWAGCGGGGGEGPGGTRMAAPGAGTPGGRPVPAEAKPLADLVPQPPKNSPWRLADGEGWVAVGEALYDVIDGAAEPLMQFGFIAALQVRYLRKDDPDTYLDLTIYRFASPGEAFGAYTIQSELGGEPIPGLGHRARVDGPVLYVWVEDLLLHAVVSRVDPGIQTEMLGLAADLADKARKGPPRWPDLFDYIPERGRFEESEWFAHTALGVRKIEPGFVTAPLALSPKTDFAAAEFGPEPTTPPGKRNRVFLIRYPDEKAAEEAEKAYLADPEAQASAVGRNTTLRRAGRFIVGSWTRDREADYPVIPRIVERLEPGPASAPASAPGG